MKEIKITHNGHEILCTLERKSVKNINLRVHRDGSVYVSASRRVPLEVIERFILQNADKIIAAVDRAETSADLPMPDIPRDEIFAVFSDVLADIFPQFSFYCRSIGAEIPQKPSLRIRLMKSRWGSCIPSKNAVTLNIRLIMYPRECIEYVIAHELCHLLEANHSAAFYSHLTAFMPDWLARKSMIEKVSKTTSPARKSNLEKVRY